jgi:transposase
VLRYRNLLVTQAVKMKNKTAGLLMEVGAEYDKKRLHADRYFTELLGRVTDVPESVKRMLWISHSYVQTFQGCQKRLVHELARQALLKERVQLLQTIPGVGEIVALTWALEVGDPSRFSSIARALSYCGLTSAEDRSADKNLRTPISKQRNKHLQTMLIEAAKLAPRWNPLLRAVHDRERERSNANNATLAVARKLVAYLLYVDKTGKPFSLNGRASA